MLLDERDLTQQASEIERLLAEVDAFPDKAMREKTLEIVQIMLALYGEGLSRMLAIIRHMTAESEGRPLLQAFADDELVSHLLLLHDLHPVGVEERVLGALQEVRPYLQSHGGNVELLGIADGVARLRLQGSCNGCPSSTVTLKLAIEDAIQKAAPDLAGIVTEGVAAPAPINFLPAAEFASRKKSAANAPSWTVVERLPPMKDGMTVAQNIDGVSVLFLAIEDAMYAYENICAVCGSPLERGNLRGGNITCRECGHQFDVRRAGRCQDVPSKTLRPIPLLVQDDAVTVALART
jgi:Fe-S cluster biogenesis protein NfuA/nitrite reductase/ring-hydroxylating ferredoxin subunit